jgi:cytochrome c peroxidase
MSLLNVEKTGPWGHDGAFTSLRAMVKHMLDPSTPYDSSQIKQKGMQNLDTVEVRQQKALAQLEYNREHGISPHKAVKLSEEEVDQLVEFLKSLTDPRLNDYDFMKRWVPDYNDPESQLLNLQEAKFLPPEATQP